MGPHEGLRHTRAGCGHARMLSSFLECGIDEDLGSWNLTVSSHWINDSWVAVMGGNDILSKKSV